MARRRYVAQGGRRRPEDVPPGPTRDPDEPFPPEDAPDEDEDGEDEADEDFPPEPPVPRHGTKGAKAKQETIPERIARLKAENAEHGREWKRLSRNSGSPPPRCHQLQELMDTKQQMIEALEPTVEVQVGRPTRGRFYTVGERDFPPGRHRMKASVAEVLRWLMDQDRIAEARRMHDLKEQRQMDPHGLEGILDPATQTDRAIGSVQA